MIPIWVGFAIGIFVLGVTVYIVRSDLLVDRVRIPLLKTLEILLGVGFGLALAVAFFPGFWGAVASSLGLAYRSFQSAPLKAGLLGMGAAGAYYHAVQAGLISTTLRDPLISALQSSFTSRLLYFAFGGFVAGTVQLADREHFAPIQALVLGASWPAFIASQIGKDTATPPPKVVEGAADAQARPATVTPPP